MTRNETGIPVLCHKCGYAWLTRSQLYFVKCPRCRAQIGIRKPDQDEAMKNILERVLRNEGMLK